MDWSEEIKYVLLFTSKERLKRGGIESRGLCSDSDWPANQVVAVSNAMCVVVTSRACSRQLLYLVVVITTLVLLLAPLLQ